MISEFRSYRNITYLFLKASILEILITTLEHLSRHLNITFYHPLFLFILIFNFPLLSLVVHTSIRLGCLALRVPTLCVLEEIKIGWELSIVASVNSLSLRRLLSFLRGNA